MRQLPPTPAGVAAPPCPRRTRRALPALALCAFALGMLIIAPAHGAPPPKDTTPPETTIESGPASPTTSTSATFTFSSNEAGSTFKCSLDGARFTACTSPHTYSGLALGEHSFLVRATDAAKPANTDPTPAAWIWTVGSGPPDTTPPETTIDSAPPSTTTSTSATFAFSSNEPGSTFQCALDGAAFAACTSPRSYSGLATGPHTFQVRATDAAGNTDPAPATYRWTIQTQGVQVSCGQVLTQSTTVGNDLVDCLGDGLVVGSDSITVDLNGHTIDGVGLGAGVRNDGHSFVTVRNGTIQQFDQGVLLGPGTQLNVVEDLAAQDNQVAGVELTGAGSGNQVRDNTMTGNSIAVSLLDGSTGNTVARNTVTGGGNRGIILVASSDNTLLANTISGAGDGGIDLSAASDSNRIEGNVVSLTGDAGIAVADSDGNQLLSNTTFGNSDGGISLTAANGGVVSGNDVRFNPTGIELNGSSGNRIEANNASNASGGGIELEAGSLDNDLLSNIVNDNAGHGIYIAGEALAVPGNLLDRNTASGNGGDGIHVAKGGHTISRNTANSNGSWGIFAAMGNTDGGGNSASGNGQAAQCFGVSC
jgi:large repetitive protein